MRVQRPGRRSRAAAIGLALLVVALSPAPQDAASGFMGRIGGLVARASAESVGAGAAEGRSASAERRRELAEEAYRAQVAQAEQWRGEPEVVLYWASWCGYCKRAEAHLVREGIDYLRRDVDVPVVASDLVELIGQKAVPVLDLDGKIYRGYDEATYDQIVARLQGS